MAGEYCIEERSVMTRETDKPSRVEEAFFNGESFSDEVDPELVALAEAPSPWTPLLLLLIAFAAGFLASQYASDARYAVSSSRFVELGDVQFWTTSDQRVYHGELVIPSNRFARLEGVAQRRAVIGGTGYVKLTGVPVFAEVPRDALDDPSRDQTFGDFLAYGGDRHSVGLPGRLIAFEDLPRRYSGITRYLAKGFELSLCGVQNDPALTSALRAERERSILALTERLGRLPSEAEELAAVGPECQKAWLYQEGATPAKHRKYLMVFLFLLGVSLVSLGLAARWVYVFRVYQRQ